MNVPATSAHRPLRWMRSPALESFITRFLQPQNPPVLVLSLPRSGSTWVGDTLGHAHNALYLYEPLTQSVNADRSLAEKPQIVVNPASPPSGYQQIADLAFSGRPYFPLLTVRYPQQWRFWHRPFRRVVIKEVNLGAGPWLLQRYRPRTILLVRHPADVLLSFHRLGWWPRDLQAISEFGRHQGDRLRAMLEAFNGYSDYRVVVYEDLCAQPLEQFRRLFEFTELKWDTNIERLIQQRSTNGNRSETYDTSRNSLKMIAAWRSQLTAEEAETLRTAFAAFHLPWYQANSDW